MDRFAITGRDAALMMRSVGITAFVSVKVDCED